MELRQPKSMNDLVYYTQRIIKTKGKAKVWVFKKECPKCGKALMHKPIDPKTGKYKTRSKEYVCSECNYIVNKEEYEDTLMANIDYVCPNCEHKGMKEVSFKRKKVTIFNEKKGKNVKLDALTFSCDNCNEQIKITKKMK